MFLIKGTCFNILWIKIDYCNGLGSHKKENEMSITQQMIKKGNLVMHLFGSSKSGLFQQSEYLCVCRV
jgi:hypothetical protein